MRVELVYAPGCRTYRKALQILEAVIAEEQLPIPIELYGDGQGGPVIRINGDEVNSSKHNHEQLRYALNASWKELTAPAC